ncbi:hypothetical protein HPB52_008535 [Rhipicephalus sanguineus]|uniref:Uncharacterized protein n=1 Tax=Rhipicephalus sanguineus TaxID=34632 RepID=A0A9D4T780_RHISA|nr:hypothetical protein HPB52_008535 [Rhipicephalus sanguineus]
MEVVVNGTDVSPKELDQPGWMEAHKALGRGRTTKKAAAGAFMDASATSKQTDASQTASQTASQKSIVEKSGASKPGEPRRPRRRAPPPQMPANDYKIFVRPRDGLNLSVCSEAEIADCIRKTLRFPDTTTITDVVQVNRAQNLVLISTPAAKDEQRPTVACQRFCSMANPTRSVVRTILCRKTSVNRSAWCVEARTWRVRKTVGNVSRRHLLSGGDGSNNECHSPLKSQPRTKKDTPRDLAVPRDESDKSRGLLGAGASPSRRCRPSRGPNPDPGIIRTP